MLKDIKKMFSMNENIEKFSRSKEKSFWCCRNENTMPENFKCYWNVFSNRM